MKIAARIVAVLVAAAYFAATIIAAASPVGACPALEGKGHPAHQHQFHGQQHDPQHSHHERGTPTSAGECLKCCIAACMVAPCLPGPTTGMEQHAFVETPVLYWASSLAIYGRAIAPDTDPPKPIT